MLALCLKIAYNILRVLKIRVLTLYLLVCGCAQLFFHAFENGNALWFWIGFALCCALTAIAWVVSFWRRRRRKARQKPPTEEPEEEAEEQEEVSSPPQPTVRYYTVKGHENFYFAEYDDRYELFEKRRDGDRYIRTDYKGE